MTSDRKLRRISCVDKLQCCLLVTFVFLVISHNGVRWLKLTVAYDGSAYAGWQIQPDKPTIQGTFEATWQRLTQESLRVTAAGRTDAGVHALGQVVGLATETRLSNDDLHRGLNALLPERHRRRVTVEDAADNFHATYDAVGKRITIAFTMAAFTSVFSAATSRGTIRNRSMPRRCTPPAKASFGRHDFSSFETAGSRAPRFDSHHP